jgi:phenylalanyl-tRNA synthetase beta chain
LVDIASARAAGLLMQFGGAKYIDTKRFGSLPKERTIFFKPNQIIALLGFDYSAEQISGALTRVGCRIFLSSDIVSNASWQIGIPSWRPDLITVSDLSEEVARINGLELIPSSLPTGKSGARLSPMQIRKRSIAQMLANNGFSEVLTSPFISPEMNKTLGFVGDRAKSFRLANPMSEEFPLLRTHLTPGLLLAAKRNLSRGAKEVSIFEIGSIFRNTGILPEAQEVSIDRRPAPEILRQIFAGVPKQPTHVAGVVVGQSELSGWWGRGRTFQWSDAIAMAVRIVEEAGNTPEIGTSDFAPWHVGRCAELTIAGLPVAHAGELHPRVLEDLGLPPRACAFVVAISEIPIAARYKAESVWTMPLALQDISLIVESNVSAKEVERALQDGAGELLESIVLFDRYDQIEEGKVSLAYTLSFRAPDRTLTALEVSEFRKRAGEFASERCGAIIRA